MTISLKELQPLPSDVNFERLIQNMNTGLKSVWEIEEFHKCSLIGTSLSIADHKKMLTKTGFQIKGYQPYEIHHVLMAQMRDKNPTSKRVESFLRMKYRDAIKNFADLPESDFLLVWEQSVKVGTFEQVYYVATIRRDLSSEAIDLIVGQLHVLAHVNISMVQKNQNTIQLEQAKNDQLQQEVKNLKALKNTYSKENKTLKQHIETLTNQLSNVQSQLEKETQRQKTNTIVQADSQNDYLEVEQLKRENDNLTIENKQLRVSNNELEKRQEEIEVFNSSLMKELKQLVEMQSQGGQCDGNHDQCQNRDLCSKRVLMVGGMTKFRHLYRELIEKSGGQFDYHDGYVKNGAKKLNAKVNWSDIVLCPVNCNSHAACLQVKNLGKKYDKPVKMLSGSSISTISSALFQSETSQHASFH